MAVATPSRRQIRVHEATATGLPALRPYFRDLWERRPFVWHLARTDLKAEHYDTFLGQLWLILNPLLMAGVYIMVRMVLRPVGTAESRNFIIAHLIAGLTFFNFTTNIMLKGATSVLRNRRMVLNTSFPRLVYIGETAVSGILDFLPSLFVLFGVLAVLGRPFTTQMFWLIPLLALQLVFSVGLASLFGAMSVFVRDLIGLLRYAARIWLFASPILYTVSEVPPEFEPFLVWNPLFPLFGMYEQVLNGEPPSMSWLLQFSAWAVGAFVIGIIYFLRKERFFAIRL